MRCVKSHRPQLLPLRGGGEFVQAEFDRLCFVLAFCVCQNIQVSPYRSGDSLTEQVCMLHIVPNSLLVMYQPVVVDESSNLIGQLWGLS